VTDRAHFEAYDLAPIWSLIEFVGQARENQKRDRPSTRAWRGDESTHVPSIAGEVVAALTEGQPMDAALKSFGDDGYDLPDGTDVKTVTRYWPPILKHPVNAKRWPEYFALVFLDGRTGYYIGKVPASFLRRGTIRDFGHGENYTRTADEVVRAVAYLSALSAKGGQEYADR
jgi:hypothetical protein